VNLSSLEGNSMFFSKENRLNREQKSIDQWFRIREMGKMKYIFKYGFLFFGLMAGSFSFIYEHWNTPVDNWFDEIIRILIFWPLTGFIYGLLTWNENEKKYIGIKRLKTKMKNQS
jgi:hypothetical protein